MIDRPRLARCSQRRGVQGSLNAQFRYTTVLAVGFAANINKPKTQPNEITGKQTIVPSVGQTSPGQISPSTEQPFFIPPAPEKVQQ